MFPPCAIIHSRRLSDVTDWRIVVTVIYCFRCTVYGIYGRKGQVSGCTEWNVVLSIKCVGERGDIVDSQHTGHGFDTNCGQPPLFVSWHYLSPPVSIVGTSLAGELACDRLASCQGGNIVLSCLALQKLGISTGGMGLWVLKPTFTSTLLSMCRWPLYSAAHYNQYDLPWPWHTHASPWSQRTTNIWSRNNHLLTLKYI